MVGENNARKIISLWKSFFNLQSVQSDTLYSLCGMESPLYDRCVGWTCAWIRPLSVNPTKNFKKRKKKNIFFIVGLVVVVVAALNLIFVQKIRCIMNIETIPSDASCSFNEKNDSKCFFCTHHSLRGPPHAPHVPKLCILDKLMGALYAS